MNEQEYLGVENEIIFRRLLAEMIELKKVKYSYAVIDGRKRKVFWN